ncbi:uncharacterized protein LOC124170242 isoform X2 [Ischnura elegans]|nr:uncharacterized protein LOC124170242 isoform X2 [Ischnura elegans]XP_046404922.1 uncharacterized protein LOC124170242 isoform X2 [Ischnura elegans]
MRNRIRKSHIGSFTDGEMRAAVHLVLHENYSIRKAAKECNVNYVTLSRYVSKQKKASDEGTGEHVRMTPKYQSRLIFTAEQEKCLADYLITCSKLCYGQSTRNTRELAYEMAVVNSIQVPKNWHDDSAAGLDWLRLFLKRNPNLSIRQPENCSLSRCTSFNAHTVKTFFDNLGAALRRSECFGDGSRIWNLDETGTSTVVNKSAKVIAEKGSKGVNNVTAGERGTLVTTCCFVSASGNTIPPAFVFPRVKFSDHMLINAPPGSL